MVSLSDTITTPFHPTVNVYCELFRGTSNLRPTLKMKRERDFFRLLTKVICTRNITHLYILVWVPPITLTRKFEPRNNILWNVRTNVGKYVVTWLEHSRESNRPLPGSLLAEFVILTCRLTEFASTAFPAHRENCALSMDEIRRLLMIHARCHRRNLSPHSYILPTPPRDHWITNMSSQGYNH